LQNTLKPNMNEINDHPVQRQSNGNLTIVNHIQTIVRNKNPVT